MFEFRESLALSELAEERVEFLPARTVLTTFPLHHPGGGADGGDGGDGIGGDGIGGDGVGGPGGPVIGG